ncbi:MAG: Ppx/GppA family phosphatase [Peptococcaceae bacterium]|nr:Ppx/GppA family phosphatase [Peptococcaceae bacterium]
MAAIDIGTNSTRLLVADITGESLREVDRHLTTTRLGEGINLGVLLPEPMEKAAVAIAGYCERATSLGAEQIVAVATSCVRDAANQNEFLGMIRQRANIDVRIINGDEEAILSYKGVLAGLPLGFTGSVVLDVGGGSTELIWQTAGQIHSTSVQVGAVRFAVCNNNEEQITELLVPVMKQLNKIPISSLAGVGGTITSLAAMDQQLAQYDPKRIHGYYLTSAAIDQIYDKLQSLTLEERKQIPGLQSARADIITGGTAIVRAVLRQLGIAGITVSESDILQGLLLEFPC